MGKPWKSGIVLVLMTSRSSSEPSRVGRNCRLFIVVGSFGESFASPQGWRDREESISQRAWVVCIKIRGDFRYVADAPECCPNPLVYPTPWRHAPPSEA